MMSIFFFFFFFSGGQRSGGATFGAAKKYYKVIKNLNNLYYTSWSSWPFLHACDHQVIWVTEMLLKVPD